MLIHTPPTRRTLPASLVFILLACTVVFWGVQYKLSLYSSAAAQRAVPAAKLLSQAERAFSVSTARRCLAASLAVIASDRPASRAHSGPADLRAASSRIPQAQGSFSADDCPIRRASADATARFARGPPARA